jgi:hypothetical protein
MHVAGGANSVERPGDGALTADLDHVVDAHAVRELFRGFVPVGRGLVVEDVHGTEASPAIELLVRGTGEDGRRAAHLCELQGEERDAARALNEHSLTGAQTSLFDERVPCGESGAGKRGSLFEAEVRRCVNEAGFGQDALGGEDAVDCAAKCGLAGERLDLAVEPVLEEKCADAVTGLEARDG